MFIALQSSEKPFYCPHCQLKKQTKTISELKATIASLSETITALQSSVESLKSSPDPVTINATSVDSNVTNTHSKPPHTAHDNKPSQTSTQYEDKKYNIVMYGIKECPPKTSKTDRLENDLQSIINEFVKVELSIQASSIKDCFRLGKYKPDALRPRPILIKFLRSAEPTVALSKISSFQDPI